MYFRVSGVKRLGTPALESYSKETCIDCFLSGHRTFTVEPLRQSLSVEAVVACDPIIILLLNYPAFSAEIKHFMR